MGAKAVAGGLFPFLAFLAFLALGYASFITLIAQHQALIKPG
jgi:hypothetical protein